MFSFLIICLTAFVTCHCLQSKFYFLIRSGLKSPPIASSVSNDDVFEAINKLVEISTSLADSLKTVGLHQVKNDEQIEKLIKGQITTDAQIQQLINYRYNRDRNLELSARESVRESLEGKGYTDIYEIEFVTGNHLYHRSSKSAIEWDGIFFAKSPDAVSTIFLIETKQTITKDIVAAQSARRDLSIELLGDIADIPADISSDIQGDITKWRSYKGH
jgi:hypothetical protein